MSIVNRSVANAAAFVLLLAVVVGARSQESQPDAAAVVSAPAQVEDELMELDEVVVYGERLITRIINAEDEFYKLYNQINDDDRYDISCPYLNIGEAGSRINSRLCLPGFMADAIADHVAFSVRCEPTFANYDANRDGRINRHEAMMSPDLDFRFDQFDRNGDGELEQFGEFRAFEDWARGNMSCYRPPPPELVLMEGTDAWYKHMMQLISSDARLGEMAGRLDGMHEELISVQRRYRDMAGAQAEARAVNRTIPNLRNAGPRPR